MEMLGRPVESIQLPRFTAGETEPQRTDVTWVSLVAREGHSESGIQASDPECPCTPTGVLRLVRQE